MVTLTVRSEILPDSNHLAKVLINIKTSTMIERHYPAYEQLSGLNRLLIFLSNYKIYWHNIWMNGDTIVVKTEPPKGEIENRIFYVYEDGRIDDNEWTY